MSEILEYQTIRNRMPCRDVSLAAPTGKARAAFMKSALWPKGTVLRIFFLGGSSSQRQWVYNIVTTNLVPLLDPNWLKFEWSHLNPSFTVDTCPIRISFKPSDGAWAYLGTESLGIPTPEPTMNLGWLDDQVDTTNPLKGTGIVVLHEFGHLLGMVHEHNSPNVRIQWRKSEVIKELSGPPNNWDINTINTNIFQKYNAADINGSAYDPKSMMHYYYSDKWMCNADELNITMNREMSALDKEWINKMYSDKRSLT